MLGFMFMTKQARTVRRPAARVAVVAVATFVLMSAAFTASPVLAAGDAPGVEASRTLTTAVAPTPTPAPRTEDDRRIIRGNQVVSGDSFTLRSGETLRGDLTVFGGTALLEEGSRVEGNVSVFGGDADIYGTIGRNFTLVAGTAHLRSSAVIEGTEHVWGGTLQRDPGAVVRGEGTRFTGPTFGRMFPFDQRGPFDFVFDLIGNVFAAVASIILITLFAVAAVALFPANVARMAETAQRQWPVSGGVGVLTLVAVPIIIAILAITICLIPAAVVVAIAWGLAILFGWAVSARIVGERMAVGLNLRHWTLIAQTALGAAVLGLIGALPLFGWLVSLLAAALGLGALVLTRVGTRPYPLSPVEPPSSSPPPQLPATTA
jgi:hypothetical protein